jgi:glucose-6-phosphate 1-epimerase
VSDDVIALRAEGGASAQVHRFGAHVTSWMPAPGDEERLFLSSLSDMSGKSAIRGGIPVIFPQFSTEGPLPRHGFARTSVWAVKAVVPGEVEEPAPDAPHEVTLYLDSDDATRAIWHADFRAELTVSVTGDQLSVTLSIQNTGNADISFTCALHTYVRVNDTANAVLSGLHGAPYRVSSARDALIFDDQESIAFTGEIDRVYVGAPKRVILREPTREVVIDATEFPDIVVWNPGQRAAALADMEPGGERRMVCVEAGAVQQPIVLAPERTFKGTQVLTVIPAQ